jgi:hypothetical protein
MNYMLGCRECTWVNRDKYDSDDLSRLDYQVKREGA